MRADQPNAGMAIEGRREFEGVRSFSHEAMATVFEVHAAHPDARYAAQAAQAAFDLADRLERELSRFIPNSDISRINGLAAGSTVQVGPAAMECLVIARHMFDVTDGAFDVSIGTGLPSLELDREDCLVRAARSGTRIDLGGIGKGYAVDLMAELLEDWGLEQALVHGGFSSVLALEAPPDLEGWPLTLSDPAAPSHILARRRSEPPGGARAITSWTRAQASRHAGAARHGSSCPGRRSPDSRPARTSRRGSRRQPSPTP